MTDFLECNRCGLEVRRKRLAQVYCSKQCRDSAAKVRQRSADTSRPLPRERRSADMASNLATTASRDQAEMSPGVTLLVPDTYVSLADCLTTGALRGDDYPLEYYEDGYPKLPACLDRRRKLVLAEAA